eukprot:IDg6515t1
MMASFVLYFYAPVVHVDMCAHVGLKTSFQPKNASRMTFTAAVLAAAPDKKRRKTVTMAIAGKERRTSQRSKCDTPNHDSEQDLQAEFSSLYRHLRVIATL